MRTHFVPILAAALVASGCGGGSPSTPTPTPTPSVPTFSISATVFYDENANGLLDAGEAVRVPGVEVVVGTGTGRSAAGTGIAQVTGIQEGLLPVGVRLDSVPTYYQPLPVANVQVPGGPAEVRVPLTLPIGNNQPNVYFGYGDSITAGEFSSDRQGYASFLQNLLGPYFARADVRKFGRPGTNSAEGAERARLWIPPARAAYVLILYGTNDWQDQNCQNKGVEACFTVDRLRDIVDVARGAGSLPVLGTIPPANPALAPAGRNAWIDQMNVRIKAMALQQQVLLADVNAVFKASPAGLAPLFTDDVHPNDAGYQVLAQAWFGAITRGRAASASASRRFGFGLR